MKVYSAVIECDPQTGLFVGFVPGFPGAHSQGVTLDEVNHNLQEVIAMLLEDGDPRQRVRVRGGAKRCCWLSFGQPSRSQTKVATSRLLRQIVKDIGLTVGELLKHR